MSTTLLPPLAPPPEPENLDRTGAEPEVPAELREYRRRYLRRLLLWSAIPVLVVVVVALKLLSLPALAGVSQATYSAGDFDQTIAASDGLGPVNVLEPWVRHFDRGTGLARSGFLVDARTSFESALTLVPAKNVSATCLVRTDLALVVEQQGDSAVLDGDLSKANAFYTHALQVIDESPDGCFDDPDSSTAPPTKKPLNDEKARLQQKQQATSGGSGDSSQGGGSGQGDPSQGGGSGQGDSQGGGSGQGQGQGSGGSGGGSSGSGSGSGSQDPLDQLQQQNDDAQTQQQQNNDRNRQFDQTPKDYTGKPW